MDKFDSKPYCESAIKFVLQFGKEFSYKSNDIEDMEGILEIIHNDYKSKKITEETAQKIAISLGIYLGQVMLDTSLSKYGYIWVIKDNEPCLVKNDVNQMFPITKVWKRIANGNEDNVKSFYDVGIVIAEGHITKK